MLVPVLGEHHETLATVLGAGGCLPLTATAVAIASAANNSPHWFSGNSSALIKYRCLLLFPPLAARGALIVV